MDFKEIVTAIKDLGFPIAVAAWVLYLYTSNGKTFIAQMGKLNDAFNEMVKSNNKSINNLIKQNNFMLHALSSLITGHRESARQMIEQGIISNLEENEKSDKEKEGDKS